MLPRQTFQTELEPSTPSENRQSLKAELVSVILVVLGVFAALAFGAFFSINQLSALAVDRLPTDGQYPMALRSQAAYLTFDLEMRAALEARGSKEGKDAASFKSSLERTRAAAALLQSHWLALGQMPPDRLSVEKGLVARVTATMDSMGRAIDHLQTDPPAARRWLKEASTISRDLNVVAEAARQVELSDSSNYRNDIRDWTSRAQIQILVVVTFLFLAAAAALTLGWLREQKRLAAIEQMSREQLSAVNARMSALDEADASQAVRQTFVNVVAHELRTPMQTVVTATDTIEMSIAEHGNGSVKAALKRIRHAIGMMRAQLTDLLEYAKSEDPKLAVRVEPFSLAALVKKIDESYQPIAHAKGLTFSVTMTPDNPPSLVGDPIRLSQVINNLVDNAIKYTPVGAVSVMVNVTSQGLSVDVADQGIGIDDEDMAGITTPFARGRNVPKEIAGSGLGLAIVDRLVKLMGGELILSTVSRTAPRGTRASVHVPLPRWNPECRSVLVIDDRLADDFVDMLKQFATCTPLSAKTGAQGIETAVKNAANIEMILLDIQLPDISGAEVAKTLRSTLGDLTPPIIAITAFPDQIPSSANHLFAAILEKPVTSRDIARVRKTFAHSADLSRGASSVLEARP